MENYLYAIIVPLHFGVPIIYIVHSKVTGLPYVNTAFVSVGDVGLTNHKKRRWVVARAQIYMDPQKHIL